MEFVIKWTMPRLFLVSLVRVCTRIRTPRFADVVILSISARAFCAVQRATRRHRVIRWSASPATRTRSTCFREARCAWKASCVLSTCFFSKKVSTSQPVHTSIYYCFHRNKRSDVTDSIYCSWFLGDIDTPLNNLTETLCRWLFIGRSAESEEGIWSKGVLPEQRYLTSVIDNEFRLLRVRRAVHEYCKLERAVLFGYEAWLASPSTRIKLSRLINLACPYGAACARSLVPALTLVLSFPAAANPFAVVTMPR